MYRAIVVVIAVLTRGIHVGVTPPAAGDGRICVRLSTVANVPLEDVCIDYRSVAKIGGALRFQLKR